MPTTSLNTTAAGQQITRDNLHWGTTLGQAAGPVSFGFRTTAPGYSVDGDDVQGTFTPFSAAEQVAARDALATWASIANITFSDFGNSNSATIEFANYQSSTDNSEAFAFYPGSTSASSSAGDVFVNTYYASTINDAHGTYEYMTFLHEIGHTLGLEHPADYNAGPSGIPTYQDSATYLQDTRQYSLMSYFDETYTGGHYTVYDETPMLDDIAAIQRLYGANTTTRTGSDTYGFHSDFSGTAFDITSATQHVVFTAYDCGGSDTFDFSGYSQAQTIDLNAEHFSSVGGDTDNVCIAQNVTIENAIGGSGNDTIIGNHAANVLTGGAGDDYIYGNGGGDTFNGGDGNDYLVGGAGADAFIGGAGSDTASYESAAAGLTARLDHPNLNTGEAAGDSYNGIENLHGSQFADTLCGDSGSNVLTGGGDDDSLWGFGGGDTLDGGDGNDYLVGAAGADTFIGGDGFDTVSYYFAATGLTVRLDHPNLNTGEAAGDTYSGVENIYGSQFSDVLVGDSGHNVLIGWAGNDSLWGLGGGDTLDGGDGNDYLVGGSGADTFIGGAGSDTVSYELAVTGLTARLDHPNLNTGEAAGDSYNGIENLHGSQFADTLCGDSGSNVLTGLAGNDSLWGLGGGDTLEGGDGNDYLVGAAGADTFIGGAGSDTVSYYFAGSGLVARLDQPELNTGDAAGDTYSGIENFYGGQFADTLCGDSGSNVLTGWAGNDSLWGFGGGDTLDGGDGNDYLVGASGADTFIGGAGSDTVSYYFAATGLTARLDHPNLNTGEAAGDTYSGVENLYGSQFNDTLAGDSNANVLTGWGGNDTFVFATAPSPTNIDVVADFAVGADKIALDHNVFTALSVGTLPSDAFFVGTASHDATDRIVYDAQTGALNYDADGSGSTHMVQFATLTAGLNLHNSDFIVV